MIPKEIIEKAIAGGWHSGLPIVYVEEDIRDAEIALDPLFWQALDSQLPEHTQWHAMYLDNKGNPVGRWHYFAGVFYDLILTGQPTDKFWADLLS